MTSLVSARLSRAALRHNLACARQHAPQSRVLAVIKGDAYGHGLLEAAHVLADNADGFGVARLETAITLRRAFPEMPILVMSPAQTPESFRQAGTHGLACVVHSQQGIEALSSAALPQPVDIWLKVDTGMHRLGLPPETVISAFRQLEALPGVRELTLMSHLAAADETDSPVTDEQLARFHEATRPLSAPVSLANSAGVLAWPDTHGDWIRPGIMLYGADPLDRPTGDSAGLQPVMTLTSEVLAVRTVHAGDTVGYNGLWTAPDTREIATVAGGYADGYPRHAPNGTPVKVGDHTVPLVGRISMDMLTVDVTGLNVTAGDPVTLWGDGLPVNTVAQRAGTISYELLTGVTGRVTREWT